MLLLFDYTTKCCAIRIYIGAKLEYEMLSNISCFTDLRYAFIALVMLLFRPIKNVPSSTVCHVYNCAEDSHEKAQ